MANAPLWFALSPKGVFVTQPGLVELTPEAIASAKFEARQIADEFVRSYFVNGVELTVEQFERIRAYYQQGKVFLHLFHGRKTPNEQMDDWGTDGPVIGPLDYVHTTYMCDVKFSMSLEVADKFFPEEAQRTREQAARNNHEPGRWPVDHHLPVTEGLIFYDGTYYGDWSVSSSPTG